MAFLGDLLRDAVAGGSGGACCRFVATGEPMDCSDSGENPQTCVHNGTSVFFYPGLFCSEVTCGTQACCKTNPETSLKECSNEETEFDILNPTTTGCLGGEFQGPGIQCASVPCEIPVPEDKPDGCMTEPKSAPRSLGGFEWNTDACQNAQFTIVLRNGVQWPAKPSDRQFSHINYAEPVSNGPIRAFDAAPGVEPCATHYGKMIITPDGYVRMAMCGQYDATNPNTLAVSEGRFYLENDSIRPSPKRPAPEDGRRPVIQDNYRRVDNGYATLAVGYRAPQWVEAFLHSDHPFCGARP